MNDARVDILLILICKTCDPLLGKNQKTKELIGIISISSGRGGLQVTMKRTLMFSSASGGVFGI
jgi:hypothetical protein